MVEKQDVVNYMWEIQNEGEIKEFWDILKRRHRQLDEQKITLFSIGDKVKFKGRFGKIETGTITQVNRNTVKVKTEITTWRVSPSLLEKC